MDSRALKAGLVAVFTAMLVLIILLTAAVITLYNDDTVGTKFSSLAEMDRYIKETHIAPMEMAEEVQRVVSEQFPGVEGAPIFALCDDNTAQVIYKGSCLFLRFARHEDGSVYVLSVGINGSFSPDSDDYLGRPREE